MPGKRPLWKIIPLPWEVQAEQELVLLPEKGLVRIICQPVIASVNSVLLERLRGEQRKQGRPIEDLLEDALRLLLDPPPPGAKLPALADAEAPARAADPR